MHHSVRAALRGRPVPLLCAVVFCIIVFGTVFRDGRQSHGLKTLLSKKISPLGRHGRIALAKGNFDVSKQQVASPVDKVEKLEQIEKFKSNSKRRQKKIPEDEAANPEPRRRSSRTAAKQHVLQKAENAISLDLEGDDDDEGNIYADLAEDALEDGNEKYDDEHDGEAFTDRGDSRQHYHEIYSLSRSNRKYYAIHFDGIGTKNANLIPHPTAVDMWIAVASHLEAQKSEAIYCSVGMMNEVLICEKTPRPLDIGPGPEGLCEGMPGADAMNALRGPQDIRVFWGPDKPYVLYMSQSRYACMGVWLQDARQLLAPYKAASGTEGQLFHGATELRRPKTAVQTPATIEKNWFLFWDSQGAAYVHFDLWPHRSYAKLDFDGSVGSDLAPTAGLSDQVCLLEYMPLLNVDAEVHESIQQATNSLTVTLCKRQESSCKPSSNNTFIMHIFHRRRSHAGHDSYQPYLVLFKNEAPFKIHAISERAYWIHGRSLLSAKSNSVHYMQHPSQIPKNHSESFYVTSMAWKRHGQQYHGYLDDPLWLSFGREDSQSGSIDISAEHLIQQMNLC